MKRQRFSILSAEGLLLRALLIVPVHFALLWWLAGRSIVSALLAPSSAMSMATAGVGAAFALVRLLTIFLLPGIVAACAFAILINSWRARKAR